MPTTRRAVFGERGFASMWLQHVTKIARGSAPAMKAADFTHEKLDALRLLIETCSSALGEVVPSLPRRFERLCCFSDGIINACMTREHTVTYHATCRSTVPRPRPRPGRRRPHDRWAANWRSEPMSDGSFEIPGATRRADGDHGSHGMLLGTREHQSHPPAHPASAALSGRLSRSLTSAFLAREVHRRAQKLTPI